MTTRRKGEGDLNFCDRVWQEGGGGRPQCDVTLSCTCSVFFIGHAPSGCVPFVVYFDQLMGALTFFNHKWEKRRQIK